MTDTSDDEMTEIAKTEVEALQELRNSGKIDENVYHKAMVMTCAVFVDEGLYKEAMHHLRGIKADYYRQVQREQFKEDADYFVAAAKMMDTLVEHGYLRQEAIQFTMGHGAA
ncbi:hypothetical protein UFOVP75_78 [uncultured Caudovirales phage]|uniref:Uncharacterized protein n=1 Tax=uncultured Caudovirales phage TaxID=2100421 RepID=A0A6J5L3T4_9CAUD|nr:hypothetical protein UFOVP75_78 [uncultured Caudovirales phage]